MNNWKEKFNTFIEPAMDRGFDDGSNSQKAIRDRVAWRGDIKEFIETEVIEKLIEEVPDKTKTIDWNETDDEFCDLVPLKQLLRAKWLGDTTTR